MAKAPERRSPAKASGGNTRKQLSTSSGTGRHSARVPKAVKMKTHGRHRKTTRNLSWWMSGS